MPLVDLRHPGTPSPGESPAEPWRRLEAGAPLPDEAEPVLAALAHWQADAPGLLAAIADGRPVGVWLEPDQDAADLAAALGGQPLDRVAAIGLLFPAFADGRAFSTARRLRLRHGYGGPLWALGRPVADQAAALLRVGFTAAEFPASVSPALVEEMTGRYGAVYQAAADGRVPVWRLRGEDALAGRAAE